MVSPMLPSFPPFMLKTSTVFALASDMKTTPATVAAIPVTFWNSMATSVGRRSPSGIT